MIRIRDLIGVPIFLDFNKRFITLLHIEYSILYCRKYNKN